MQVAQINIARELRAYPMSTVRRPLAPVTTEPDWVEEMRQTQFDAIRAGYASHGGLAVGDEVARRLRKLHAQPVSMLARWIVAREVVSFTRHGQLLLPLFQFEQTTLTLRAGVSDILAKLRDTFDEWEMAAWFILPHALLDDARPLDVIAREPAAVLDAACADRFIVMG